MSEQALVERLLQRDPDAVETLLRHYGPLMRYILSPILPEAQTREDCLSLAAMQVWEKIGTFDPDRGSFSAWLTALTRNLALDQARRLQKQASAELAPGPELPDPAPGPEAQVLRRESEAELRRAILELPPQDKLLFYRKYYYLQSTAQIAAELGTTVRAIEGRLYRLKKRLRTALGGAYHGR